MVDEHADSTPRVIPSRPKGSGSKAPWIALAVIGLIAIALVAAILLAVLFLRTSS